MSEDLLVALARRFTPAQAIAEVDAALRRSLKVVGFTRSERLEILRGQFTKVSWEPPEDVTLDEWCAAGLVLGKIEQGASWWLGDWWVFGEHRYGDRKAIVTAVDWMGPSFQSCMNAGSVSRAYQPTSRRRVGLSFSIHKEALGLPEGKQRDAWLDEQAGIVSDGGKPASVRDIRQVVKRVRRDARETELALSTAKASKILGQQLYSVILSDPPWRFEVRSRETGMDRAAANHYPVMTTDDIAAMEIPAAKNCILFLWATNPMLRDALRVMEAWGFEYKANVAWIKPNGGTGYWFSSAHELLLLGVRGEVPAPAPGLQRLSWFQANRGRHSEKPDCVYTIIEGMFPNQPKLEMFSRKEREGWSRHGNELLEPT